MVSREDFDAAARAAFAAAIGVDAVDSLSIAARVTRHGKHGLKVEGRVAADVTQTCVATLEPVKSVIEEPILIAFSPEADMPGETFLEGEDGLEIDVGLDRDDPLIDGTIDLAAIAAEFLTLAVDPYPRKPGAVFSGHAEAGEGSPFAALARLKSKS